MTIPDRIMDEAPDSDWVQTAYLFCDRLDIKRKADALHICEGITAALLAAEQRGREMERERREDLEDTLFRVKQWCDAYPLDIFPEPDFKRARELLEAGGLTLDAVSASAMRHVVSGIGKIIDAAAIRSPTTEG